VHLLLLIESSEYRCIRVYFNSSRFQFADCLLNYFTLEFGSIILVWPAAGRHRPLTGAKLYCLVTEAHVCEQFAQSRYLAAEQPRVEPATFPFQFQLLHHQAIII